mgnify:CR=1 FL=1
MLNISRKICLAVEAITVIAYNTADSDTVCPSHKLMEYQNIPKRYLENALHRMVRNGILESVRGPRGGYCLRKPSDQITIYDITRSVTNENENTALNGAAADNDIRKKVILPICQDLLIQTDKLTSAVTVRDMCQRATALNAKLMS